MPTYGHDSLAKRCQQPEFSGSEPTTSRECDGTGSDILAGSSELREQIERGTPASAPMITGAAFLSWSRPSASFRMTRTVPPRPAPPEHSLGWYRLLVALRTNALQIWPREAYTRDVLAHSFFGRKRFLLNAPDAIEGLKSFIEKRAPAWPKG